MSIVVVVGVLMLGLGIGSGLMIGARRAEPKSGDTASDPKPRAPEAKNPDSSPAVASTQGSQPSGSSEAAAGAAVKEAQDLWLLMTTEETADVPTLRRKESLKREQLRKLRPELAGFFIGKYRELIDSKKADRQYALEMAIACGGEKVATFVKELWDTPVDAQQEWMLRWMLADMISRGHLIKRPQSFPVDPALMNQARLLVDSGTVADRRLAIAILGFVDPTVVLPIVTDRFRLDANPLVRQSAILEMGRLGNEATLAMLRAERDSNTATAFAEYVQPQAVRGGPPVRAIDQRSYLRAIDDAIEHLEERLQK